MEGGQRGETQVRAQSGMRGGPELPAAGLVLQGPAPRSRQKGRRGWRMGTSPQRLPPSCSEVPPEVGVLIPKPLALQAWERMCSPPGDLPRATGQRQEQQVTLCRAGGRSEEQSGQRDERGHLGVREERGGSDREDAPQAERSSHCLMLFSPGLPQVPLTPQRLVVE